MTSGRWALGFGLVVMAATSAAAAEWVKLGSDSSGAVFHLDRSSIERGRGVAKAEVRADLSRVTSIPDRESRTLYQFRCEKRTAARLQVVEIAPSGDVTHEYKPRGHEIMFDRVVPYTINEKVMKLACERPRSSRTASQGGRGSAKAR